MSYLFAFDFDGNAADTFKRSPNGIGVREAYERGIQDVFGDEGLEAYRVVGGLQNRAPAELVRAMLDENGNNRNGLLEHAAEFLRKEFNQLRAQVPEGKGVLLDPDAEFTEKMAGEILVRQKLRYLLGEIGELWPQPCNGFIEFWKIIAKLRREGIYIKTAVISSGHDSFIAKTFQVWGLEPPDFLVTDDGLRGRKFPRELERRVKPGQLSLAQAHKDWLRQQGLSGNDFDIDTARKTRARMVYFGDDPKNDGGLAKGAGIAFGHFNSDAEGYETDGNRTFSFGDWGDIGKLLQERREDLREGRPLSEVLCRTSSGIESAGEMPPDGSRRLGERI